MEVLFFENIHKEGQTQSSTGQGIHPIRGIRNDKFDNFQGLISGLNQLEFNCWLYVPLNKSEITAKRVKKVSRDTKNFELKSKALYFPSNNIRPHNTKTAIDKSMAGKPASNGRLVNKAPET